MPHTIAITGKGGVGKTTVAALTVTRLIARGRSPVLAVDADPNNCLDAALGVRVSSTLGGVREQAREIAGKGPGAGIPKQDLLNLRIAESLVEARHFDLIAMGRPEGPGCYCYANNVLRQALEQMTQQYPHIVIDNEAGLENLSRRIVRRVQLLVMVGDPSKRGIETVGRLYDLAREMEVAYDRLAIVINRLRRNEFPEGAADLKERTKADHLLGLPESGALLDLAERGDGLDKIPGSDPVVENLDRFLDEAVLGRNGA